MKKIVIALFCAAFGSYAAAADLAGVPMKDHHVKAMGKMLTCELCHGVKAPKTRPNDKTCI
ncbi:MAG: hypothetical protein ACI4SV_06850, partial [Duodenibacillus sp.]